MDIPTSTAISRASNSWYEYTSELTELILFIH